MIKDLSLPATSTAQIRAARQADLEAVERLLAASDLPLAGVREALADFLVAEADGAIVGVAGLERRGDYGLLRSVAVSPDWRKHGVGRTLVTRVIANAEAQGVRALYLLTTTAEHYFPSFGFHATTRDDLPEPLRGTDEFQSACPASATVMCCDLDTVHSSRTAAG